MRLKRLMILSTGVACALLCAISFVMWMRSLYTADLVVWSGTGGRYFELVTIPSQFRLTRVSNWSGNQPFSWQSGRQIVPMQPVFGQQLVRFGWLPMAIGFDAGSRTIAFGNAAASTPMHKFTVAYQIIAIPFAIPSFLFGVIAIYPLWRFLRLTRLMRRRRRQGRCPACGYDLRATPGRCPECGHVA